MKLYIKYLFALIISALLVYCDDNLEDVSNDFSAGLIITPDASLDNPNDTLFVLPSNYFIPLADVSQNSLGREWTLSEGGNFLNNEFSILNDGEDFTQFIDSTKGLTSSDQIIHVLFTETGFHTIEYEGRFADSTGFALFERNFGPMMFEEEQQLWIARDTLNYVVVPDFLSPTIRVDDESSGDIILNDSIFVDPVLEFDIDQINMINDVESGEELTFSDVTTGILNIGVDRRVYVSFDPDKASANPGVLQRIMDALCEPQVTQDDVEREVVEDLMIVNGELFFTNSNNDQSGIVNIAFRDVNTDRMVAFVQRRQAGNNAPDISACFATIIPRRINVIPSSQPFIINSTGAAVVSPTSLALSVSGSLANIPADQAGNFTVSVTNPNGFSGNIAVTSATFDPLATSSIILELSEPVFDLDEITIQYANSGPSEITSIDIRVLMDTTGVIPVSNPLNFGTPLVNLLNEMRSGVEEFQGAANVNQVMAQGFFSPGNNSRTPTTWLRDDSFANNGSASLRFETAGGIPGRFPIQTRIAASEIPPGGYRINFSIFIESGTGLAEISTVFNSSGITINYDLSTIPRNEWVELEGFVTTTAPITTGGNTGRIDFVLEPATNSSATGPVRFFIDDIQLSSVNLRPTP